MSLAPQMLLATGDTRATEVPAEAVKVRMDEPVLIDQAAPEVRRWGTFAFPKIYRLPGGEVCVTFRPIVRDHVCDQGTLSPAFVSNDDGHTWQRYKWPHPGMTGISPYITRVNNGEYYCLPAVTGIQLDLSRLPKPLGSFGVSAGFPIYLLADCPADVIRWFDDLKAVRWSPKTQIWTQENVQWDHRGQLIWSYNDTPQKIPGDWSQKVYMEGPVVRVGQELMYADYWTWHETKPGQPPQAMQCSLMVSTDNGHSWTWRSTLATMSKDDNTAEPTIELNKEGELVGVMRREYLHKNPSMYLVHSKDQGYTWSEPQTLFEFGVEPQLRQLENGVMVLSFGRPGVWVSFSLDGGYSWTKPLAVIAGDPGHRMKDSSGYTSMLPIGKDSFLLAYDDFLRPNAQGELCKSILVRRITVQKASRK